MNYVTKELKNLIKKYENGESTVVYLVRDIKNLISYLDQCAVRILTDDDILRIADAEEFTQELTKEEIEDILLRVQYCEGCNEQEYITVVVELENIIRERNDEA